MEAPVEDLTPLGVLKQPKVFGAWFEVGRYSCVGEVHLNLAGARDVERRAILKRDMPAVPPPAWKLGFDQPSRSVNRARHIRGEPSEIVLSNSLSSSGERLGTASTFCGSFLRSTFRHPLWPNRCELCSTLLTVVLIPASPNLQSSPTSLARDRLMFPEALQEQAIVGDGTVQPPAKVVDPEALVVTNRE